QPEVEVTSTDHTGNRVTPGPKQAVVAGYPELRLNAVVLRIRPAQHVIVGKNVRIGQDVLIQVDGVVVEQEIKAHACDIADVYPGTFRNGVMRRLDHTST